MNIEEARTKAIKHHMTSISIDDSPFMPLIKVKRTDALLANNIRVMLSKRRSSRIHFFLAQYAEKITVIS